MEIRIRRESQIIRPRGLWELILTPSNDKKGPEKETCLRWKFKEENKKVNKKENTLSTKKATKKKRKHENGQEK